MNPDHIQPLNPLSDEYSLIRRGGVSAEGIGLGKADCLDWAASVPYLGQHLLAPDVIATRCDVNGLVQRAVQTFQHIQHMLGIHGIVNVGTAQLVIGTEAKILWMLYNDNLRILRKEFPCHVWPGMPVSFKNVCIQDIRPIHNWVLENLLNICWDRMLGCN